MAHDNSRRAQHKNRNPIQRRQFGSPFQVGQPTTPGITPGAPVTPAEPETGSGNAPAVEPVEPTPPVVAPPPPAVTPSTPAAPAVPEVPKTPDAVVPTPSTPPAVVQETPNTPPVVQNTPAVQPTPSTPAAPAVTPTPSSTPPINLQPVDTPKPSATPPANPVAPNRSIAEASIVVTQTRSAGIAAASASPSASSLPESGSSAISGGTIGGILGGLFGIALLTAIIGFLIRKFRARKQKGDADGDFNPMVDDDVPGPGMVERRMNMTSPGPGPSYGATSAGPNFSPQAYGTTPHGNYGGNNDQYGPQYAVGNYDAGAPHNYAHDSQQTFQSYEQAMAPANGPQFVNHGAIGGSPLSPVGPYDTYDLPATPGTAVAPGQYLSRQPSTGLATPGPYGQSALSPADPNYVDLSRSSVSPFQAQQYAEIHARLGPTEENMPVPPPAHFNQQQQQPNQRSPFGDDDDDAQYAAPQYANHNRIDSIPPSLPNISVEQAGNDSFSPASFNFPGGVATGESPVGGAFPKSPLPNATFSASGHSELDHAPPAPVSAPVVPAVPAAAAPVAEHRVSARLAPAVPAAKRPETVYDDEDPYGGI